MKNFLVFTVTFLLVFSFITWIHVHILNTNPDSRSDYGSGSVNPDVVMHHTYVENLA